jgi:tetratricopeptide (TPR) repeat protein
MELFPRRSFNENRVATSLKKSAYERAVRLHNRAAKCQSAGEPVRPERLYLRSLELKEQLFGPQHLEIALTLNNLGLYYKSLGRLVEARGAYTRALGIFQMIYGASHPLVGDVLYNQAQLLRKESEALERRARIIQETAAELADPDWRKRAVINQELASYRLSVGPSRIHRFGVFAGEAIPANVRVIEYTGERAGRSSWVKRTENRSYLLWMSKYWCIDGSVGGSGAELINHCCEPNCVFERKRGRAWVRSLRAIAPGEELLLDYHFPKDSVPAPCYCGAPSCRGTINMKNA